MGQAESRRHEPHNTWQGDVFAHVCAQSSLSGPQRTALTLSRPFIVADTTMFEALTMFNERLFDVDVQLSMRVNLAIANFYMLYARLLVEEPQGGARKDERDHRIDTLMRYRRSVLDDVVELQLKVIDVRSEPAYRIIARSFAASMNSCVSALWSKHGYTQTVEMYGPTPM